MRTTLLASLAAAAFVACGPGSHSNDAAVDAGPPPVCPVNPPDPCACAEQGPPDFSHDDAGTPSPSSMDYQVEALTRANHWRTAAGLAPLNASAQIEQGTTAHAHYMASDPQNTCWPNPHLENMSCVDFTGVNPWDRMSSAGYSWSQSSEVINWEDTPTGAIDGWIWTVYHRRPFMSWQLVDTGFSHEMGTFDGRPAEDDVMDFGAPRSGAMPTAPSAPVVFPVPGQINVKKDFAGFEEGPTPPGPGGGAWPNGVSSGTVVSVHFPTDTWTVTEHHIFLADTSTMACTEVDSTYISKDNDPNLMGANDVFLYANQPLRIATRYVVMVVGTFNGAPWQRVWAFTTGV